VVDDVLAAMQSRSMLARAVTDAIANKQEYLAAVASQLRAAAEEVLAAVKSDEEQGGKCGPDREVV